MAKLKWKVFFENEMWKLRLWNPHYIFVKTPFLENCYEFSKLRLDLGFKVRVRVGVSSGRFPLTITSNCGLQSLFKDHVNVNLNKTRIPWLHAFSKSETVLTNANFFQKRNRFDLSRVVYCEVILPSIYVNLCRINFKYLNWHES